MKRGRPKLVANIPRTNSAAVEALSAFKNQMDESHSKILRQLISAGSSPEVLSFVAAEFGNANSVLDFHFDLVLGEKQ